MLLTKNVHVAVGDMSKLTFTTTCVADMCPNVLTVEALKLTHCNFIVVQLSFMFSVNKILFFLYATYG